MIAAVGSVFITPWNLSFNSPLVIHYTLDILGCFIGPLFGILLYDFYVIHKRSMNVDALFSEDPKGVLLVRQWLQPPCNQGIDCLHDHHGYFCCGSRTHLAWFIGVAAGTILYHLMTGQVRMQLRNAALANQKA